MEDFIRTEQFQRVLLKMENYTTLESFNKHKQQVGKEMTTFNERFDAIPSLGDLEQQNEEMRQWVRELNEKNSKRGQCAKDRADLMKEIDAMRREIQGAREDLQSQGKSIRGIQHALTDKIGREDWNNLMELVNVLPGKEEVTELREHVGTSIAKFSKDNNTFQADFEKHLEIIRRYDEVLSNKASKHTVIELDKNMSEKYNQ